VTEPKLTRVAFTTAAGEARLRLSERSAPLLTVPVCFIERVVAGEFSLDIAYRI